jgi:hypothetical protein
MVGTLRLNKINMGSEKRKAVRTLECLICTIYPPLTKNVISPNPMKGDRLNQLESGRDHIQPKNPGMMTC